MKRQREDTVDLPVLVVVVDHEVEGVVDWGRGLEWGVHYVRAVVEEERDFRRRMVVDHLQAAVDEDLLLVDGLRADRLKRPKDLL